MEKHTPGSWYRASTGNHQGLVISELNGENIAVTYDKKNASLVAAAPDLLAACEALLRDCGLREIGHGGRMDRAIGAARAAIAKATS